MTYEHKPGTLTLFLEKRMQGGTYPMFKGQGKDLDGNPIKVSLFAVVKDKDEEGDAIIAYYNGIIWKDENTPPHMSDKPETGQFRLFKNNYDNDKAPGFSGPGIGTNGEKIKIAAWYRTAKYGQMLSCQMQPEQTKPDAQRAEPSAKAETNTEEVPF